MMRTEQEILQDIRKFASQLDYGTSTYKQRDLLKGELSKLRKELKEVRS
jgi:ribosome-interacting GTPase 1